MPLGAAGDLAEAEFFFFFFFFPPHGDWCVDRWGPSPVSGGGAVAARVAVETGERCPRRIYGRSRAWTELSSGGLETCVLFWCLMESPRCKG